MLIAIFSPWPGCSRSGPLGKLPPPQLWEEDRCLSAGLSIEQSIKGEVIAFIT